MSQLEIQLIAGLALVGSMLALQSGCAPPVGAITADEAEPAGLVFVTEDNAQPQDGCDAITVFREGLTDPVFRGPRRETSVGRLAVSEDQRFAIAGPSATFNGLLYTLFRSGGMWSALPEVEAAASTYGGVAISGDSLLVAANGQVGFAYGPPYRIEKYSVDDLKQGAVGTSLGTLDVEDVVAVVLPETGGAIAHAVTSGGRVHTFSVESMSEIAEPFELGSGGEPADPPGILDYLNLTHAALSPDGRYLIRNRWNTGELSVGDLVRRTAWTLATPSQMNGGIAFNRGWINPGLLAVHTGPKIYIYEFQPPERLVELGTLEVQAPWAAPGGSGPVPSIAWSTSGSRLIAATDEGSAEFIVVDVTDGGRTLSKEMLWTACPIERNNYPNSIVTGNGLILPTATASPTATTTPPVTVASQIYLPVALAEHCTPDTSYADTMLVLDASTSMLEEIRPRYTKREAAADAAGRFVDLLKMGDHAGVVYFNDTAVLEQGLTGDKPALHAALSRIVNRQFTRLDLGITKAREELGSGQRDPSHQAVIILLTDGKANPEPVATAIVEAQMAKDAGITVFTIGLGAVENLDDWALRQIASRPDYYYRTPDADALTAIYEEIAGVIPCPPERFWGRRVGRLPAQAFP